MDDKPIRDHRWFVRGPFCYGIGETKAEAIGLCLKSWPTSMTEVPKPRGTNPERWTRAQRRVMRFQVIPTGTIYVNGFDGGLEWAVKQKGDDEKPPVNRFGEPMQFLDHDPVTCDTCTLPAVAKPL